MLTPGNALMNSLPTIRKEEREFRILKESTLALSTLSFTLAAAFHLFSL